MLLYANIAETIAMKLATVLYFISLWLLAE